MASQIGIGIGGLGLMSGRRLLSFRPNRLRADSGLVDITGQSANLVVSQSMAADSGSLAITGQSAILAKTMRAISGAISVSGQDATLTIGGAPTASNISLGSQQAGTGNVPLTITDLSIDATVYVGAYTVAQSGITAAQIAAGTDVSDGTAVVAFADNGPVTTAAPSINLTIPDGLDPASSLYLYAALHPQGAVWTLGTASIDTQDPTFDSSVPADDTTGVAVGVNLIATFSEAVTAGAGNEEVYLYRGVTLVETFDVTSGIGSSGGSVAVSGTDMTINPGAAMQASSAHNVQWQAGAVVDGFGNPVAANASAAPWSFTTGAAAAGRTYAAGTPTGTWGDPTSVALPPNVAGDQLFIAARASNAALPATISGWTTLGQTGDYAIYHKVSSGSEPSSVTIDLASGQNHRYIAFVVTGSAASVALGALTTQQNSTGSGVAMTPTQPAVTAGGASVALIWAEPTWNPTSTSHTLDTDTTSFKIVFHDTEAGPTATATSFTVPGSGTVVFGHAQIAVNP